MADTSKTVDRRDRRAVVWSFEAVEYPAERFALASEEPLYLLPEGWWEMEDEAAARAALERRAQDISARLAAYGQRAEGTHKPRRDREPNAVAAEPSYPSGWIYSEKTYPDPTQFDDSCPCCGDVVYTEGWHDDGNEYTCPSCGYNPEHNYTVLPAQEAPEPECFGRQGVTTYRNDEQAASNVIYHDGEPVTPDVGPITEWEYPVSWDFSPEPVRVKRDRREERRERGARPSVAIQERHALALVLAAFDAHQVEA